jgi:methyl-accepting chemotaxis protein
MRLNSLAAKIITAMLISATLIFSIQIYLTTNSELTRLTNNAKEYLIAKTNQEVEKINSDFLRIDQGAKGLASLIAANKENNTDLNLEYIRNLIKDIDLVIGSGFWMEPYKYSKNQKYFGPYLYKDNDDIILTWDYSNSDYDYFNYDWYKNGFKSKDSTWTEPYYDEVSEITMMTYTTPIYSNNEVIGVTTLDISLKDMINYIKNIKVSENGQVYLINDIGNFIVSPDHSEHSINIKDKAKSKFSGFASKILSKENTQIINKQLAGEDYFIAYSSIGNTGLKLILTFPLKDLGIKEKVIFSLITSIFSLILFMIILYYLLKYLVINPITITSQFSQFVSQGDFTKDIPSKYTKRADEIGKLAISFDTMSNNLRDMIRKLMNISEQMASSSQELSASAEEGTTSIEGTNELIENITATIEQISASAERVANFAQESNLKTEIGTINIQDTLATMTDISKTVARAVTVVNTLNNTSQKIEQIIEMITNIADQTNLLALNAAIEAARAGEAGKGFAVVADEIRDLAEETNKATEEIKKLISETKDKTTLGIEVINEVANITKHGEDVVSKTGEVFAEISSASEETSIQIEETAKATHELAQNSSQITESTNEIKNMSDEIAYSAQELSNMSIELSNLIDKFKV